MYETEFLKELLCIFSGNTGDTFIKAKKGSIYNRIYEEKMSDESFSLKSNFDAIRDFVDKHEPSTAFYTNRGLIPDDVICKVS